MIYVVDEAYYNPLINFRAILLAILDHVVPNRRTGIRHYLIRVNICPMNFQLQESMTKSTKWVSFQFLSSLIFEMQAIKTNLLFIIQFH